MCQGRGNGEKVSENGEKVSENGEKVSENGEKVSENGEKVSENGKKVSGNSKKGPLILLRAGRELTFGNFYCTYDIIISILDQEYVIKL